MPVSAEQQARDMLERAGVDYAQSMAAGDLVEIANLIARDAAAQEQLVHMTLRVNSLERSSFTGMN